MLYDEKEAVFYNKVQVLNRDLSVQVIKVFSETIEQERNAKYLAKLQRRDNKTSSRLSELCPPTEGISVLEALAATGLRSIRYVQEVPKIRSITLNDLSQEATKVAMNNIRYNNVSMDRIAVRNEDACRLMYGHKEPTENFDVIDLDPYGAVAPFLDLAVQAVAGDGGLLCITSTDAPVLHGSYPEVCYAKYGSMPLKGKYKHEMALRILLHSIEASASRYKRHIVPWLSVSVDFYVRVFVRVYESPAEVKNSYTKRIMTYQSTQCGSFINQPIGTPNRMTHDTQQLDANGLPRILRIGADNADNKMDNAHKHYGALRVDVPSMREESGGHWRLGGPFWGAPMHDQIVVDKVLARVLASLQLQRDANAKGAGVKSAQNNAASGGTAGTITPRTTSADSSDQVQGTVEAHAFPIATAERLSGILTSISEELKDVPFYYSLPDLASTLQCVEPTHTEFKAALVNAGYKVSGFHHDATAIKTDAPNTVVRLRPILFTFLRSLGFLLVFIRCCCMLPMHSSVVHRKFQRLTPRWHWRCFMYKLIN